MSAIPSTATARLGVPRRLIVFALIVAVAAAAVTVALVVGAPGVHHAARSEAHSALANDGSQHPGRRP